MLDFMQVLVAVGGGVVAWVRPQWPWGLAFLVEALLVAYEDDRPFLKAIELVFPLCGLWFYWPDPDLSFVFLVFMAIWNGASIISAIRDRLAKLGRSEPEPEPEPEPKSLLEKLRKAFFGK